jgi:small-conductance mechanosensitive channel/CRP-like cAMP-binding protein
VNALDPLFGPGRADRSLELAAVLVAVVLLLAARLLLPRADRARVREPLALLLGGLAFGVISYSVGTVASVGRVALFLYLLLVLASAGRSLVLLAIDVVVSRRTHRAPPRIFRDLTQAIVYVVVLLMTLRGVGVEPGSLLTTSALLTAVVGLALQDTLGNLVSGLALQMQRPFEVGDWIQFDPDARQIGEVTEVNWRAITVLTSDMVEVIVPNALLAKTAIRNYSKPTRVQRRYITISGPYGVPPARVQGAIAAAVTGIPGVVAEPAPWVQTRSFADSGVEYAVYFFVDDFPARERIDGQVRDRVWYALQRANVTVPFPVRTVHMHAIDEESERRARDRELARRDEVLRCVDFLDVLPPETHRALAAAAQVKLFAAGEVVVRQGERSTELFIIDRGEVAVELARDDGARVTVARLSAGQFFGEMGLMTGEERKASVRATVECELLVIDHDAFQATLAPIPGVVDRLGELLAARAAELDAVASERPQGQEGQERSRRLISQIKDFFKLV